MSAPVTPDLDARTVLLLSIADDELVIGHRHLYWTGVAPSLEEDLAFATISQDEVNHADVWYQVLVGNERAAVDALGLGRRPDEYRHAVLCERAPRDFAYSLVRQFLYDHFDLVRLAALAESADTQVAATARRLVHEERYHLLHADEWLERLANGGPEAVEHLRASVQSAWPEALWLFEPLPGEGELVASGLLPVDTGALLARWLDEVVPRLEVAGAGELLTDVRRDGGWHLPEGFFAQPGGRRGTHTADWTEDAWPEMTALYRAHPGARW